MVKDSENAPNACIATEAPCLARQPREVYPPTLRSRAGSQGGQNEVVLVDESEQYWSHARPVLVTIIDQY